MAAPMFVSIFMVLSNVLCIFGADPIPTTCAPLGYDIHNLTVPNYWYFDTAGDKCINGSKTCRFYTAFCKQLPPSTISTNCTDSSVCQTSSNIGYKVAAYRFSPFNKLEVNGFYAAFKDGQQITTVGGKKCNLSILYQFQCNKDTIWNPAVTDSKSGAKIPAVVDVTFNQDVCSYQVKLNYAGACYKIVPATKVSSLSTGSIMLIILFVMTLLYLVVGSSYNFCQGQTGGAICPNASMWYELRELIGDGCGFSWRTITCQAARQTDIDYENI